MIEFPMYRVMPDGEGNVLILSGGVPIIEMNEVTARQLACLLLKHSRADVRVDGNTIIARLAPDSLSWGDFAAAANMKVN